VILGIDWGFAPGLHETVAIAAQRQGERFVVLMAEKIEGKPEEKQERIKAIYHELQVERAFAICPTSPRTSAWPRRGSR
jgi:hypothetical protein